MARVFLSYAHDDVDRAKLLAKALELAGHHVWWDSHVHGGSRFAAEIDRALQDAEVVIVLWSATAVKSAWVQDEAAEGRDSDRLVPVVLDDTKPPLGFRQFQSIPFTGWSGRGNPPNFQDLLTAISDIAGGREIATEGSGAAVTPPRRRKVVLAALAALGALLLAVTGWWFLEGRGEASTPVLAVLPFSDLSPQGDKVYFAEGVAEAILTVLAKEQGLRVLGRSTARQLHTAGKDADKMRRALGVTHVLEGSARSDGDQLRMSVRLVDASDGQQLWAEEYRRRMDNVFAVQDEIGRAVAQRLKGSFSSTAPPARQLTSADAYTLYLAARAKLRDRELTSLKEALQMAKQVIAADPDYAPGHALYAELIWHLTSAGYGTLPMDKARKLATAHARRAIALAPNLADGHAILGWVSFGDAAVESLSRAVELDPSRAEFRVYLSRFYDRAGKNAKGLEQLRTANEIDPLFRPAMWNYAYWLAASERFDDAERVIRQYEQRGGSRADSATTRAEIAANYRGDFSEGIRLVRLALRLDAEPPGALRELPFQFWMIGLQVEARKHAANIPLYSRLLFSGYTERLLSQARQDGPNLFNQGDASVAAAALAEARDWDSLVRVLDQRAPDAPSLCTLHFLGQTQVNLHIVKALVMNRRAVDASRLLHCMKTVTMARSRGPIRTYQLSAANLDLIWAQIHALEGRPERAFPLLQRAVTRGFRTSYGKGLSEFPQFDPYRSLPQYAAIDARLKQLIAKERAEVLRMQPNLRLAA